MTNAAELLGTAAPALRPSWWARGLRARDRLPDPTHPAWAAFVEHTVSAAPIEGPDIAVGLEWHVAFAAALAPLTRAARDRVMEQVGDAGAVELTAVCDGWSAQLGRRLAALAARTLVAELHTARAAGRLRGGTPAERFTDFARTIGSRSGLAGLFAAYPVLGRLLGQECGYAVDTLVELIERFSLDRPSIVAAVHGGVDPGPVTRIDFGNGDTHRRGRAVATLSFASGAKLMYKPRSLAPHQRFGLLVAWLNARLPGLDLRTAAAIDRRDYGWMEYVARVPCANAAEVELFYRRQGVLLALLYAVDGTDIHCENLIAHGSHPVLVDVETLFHPDLARADPIPDPAAQALIRSVCRTALLPRVLIGEHGGFDLSGLGGDQGALYPTEVAGWEAAGTDRMRLVRRAAPFTGADNRPRLDGREVDPGDHLDELLAGFRVGYDSIAGNRDAFAALLTAGAGDEIRVVVRPTAYYATFLDESTHPVVLRDAFDRDSTFGQLVEDVTDDDVLLRLARHELDDLWAGDIPLFTGRPESRDLWSAAGQRIPDVLARCSLAAASAKVWAFGARDRRTQEWLITATLATRPGAAGRPRTTMDELGGTDLLDAARRIADDLADRAIHDQWRANWLGLELLDGRHWTVAPLGASLGEGYPGVALFLAQLAVLTGAERYGTLARAALRPLPRLVDHVAADAGLMTVVGGGIDGLGGIAYALTRAAFLLDDAELAGRARTATELAEAAGAAATTDPMVAARRIAGEAPGSDLSLGHGELRVLDALTILADAGDDHARRELRRRANMIIGSELRCGTPAGVPTPGLLTGLAGIGYGLLRIGFSLQVPSLLPLWSTSTGPPNHRLP
ncbi:type 2 lanthipeptide synthetase LanM [Actinoplanes sp. NPDC049548]|uniref:type 2 lanthipeptide synthetase LanM n=1 Tax=Actinoplanes sp. NPDC049548 TaxID=3155152 RepID=UPI00342D01FE